MSTPSQVTFPRKLRRGDRVRVIAPAQSRAMIMEHDNTRWIDERFAAMGLELTFGEHVDERDIFDSSTIEHRVADLHAAFADDSVAAILTVIGGFNSNELLPHLDWELIGNHPKILCGYSDITALQNAVLARTGLVTYSGPHWSSFGMRDHFEPTGEWFRAALMSGDPVEVTACDHYTDDAWFADQDNRTVQPNPGWRVIQPGTATGRIIGGNLCTLNLLQGTENMPSLDGALLFLEDDSLSDAQELARNLTSLLQLPDAGGVTGLVLGRFQDSSGITRAHLDEIIARQSALAGKPVIWGVDFGHTSPMITFPVGGRAELLAGAAPRLVISEH